jgi:Rad3-related DNA helicase
MVDAVAAVLARHPKEKVLVHTVSYDLARALCDGLRSGPSRVYKYTTARERDTALRQFREHSEEGAVLVAPSMDRGVDLPGDECAVIVIAKVPFPNIGDRQINARLRAPGGKTWYTVQTARTIVQMSGRGMRHTNDHCTTYILDSQFVNNLWNKARRLFPPWWVEAIDWSDNLELPNVNYSL